MHISINSSYVAMNNYKIGKHYLGRHTICTFRKCIILYTCKYNYITIQFMTTSTNYCGLAAFVLMFIFIIFCGENE
jgi:hypothetical protein